MPTTPSHSYLRPASQEEVQHIADVVWSIVPGARVDLLLTNAESWVVRMQIPTVLAGAPLVVTTTETAWRMTWGVGAAERPIPGHLMPDNPADLREVVRAALRFVDHLRCPS